MNRMSRMREERYSIAKLHELGWQIRAMGDLLLCYDAKQLDFDKLGQMGLALIEKADSIRVYYRRLMDDFKKRSAEEVDQEKT